jgi:hypothetical protein
VTPARQRREAAREAEVTLVAALRWVRDGGLGKPGDLLLLEMVRRGFVYASRPGVHGFRLYALTDLGRKSLDLLEDP